MEERLALLLIGILITSRRLVERFQQFVPALLVRHQSER